MEPLSWLLLVALIVVTLTLSYTGARYLRASDQVKLLDKALSEEKAAVAEKEKQLLDKEASRALAAEERQSLNALLDAVPRPVWRRDQDLRLSYCNAAFESAVGQSKSEVLKRSTELVGQAAAEAARALARKALESGEEQTMTSHVVADGERKLFLITERTLPDGTLVGHARDLTEVEEMQRKLDRHQNAQSAVLENLSVGISIYGPEMRLNFYNVAFARIWGIDESFLTQNMHMTELMEHLRELRRLPEQIDFSEYKRRRVKQFQTLIDPLEELLHTPDGRTIRMIAFPHPFGGVVLTYEDVTDALSLETRYNTLIEVQRETLDNLSEGVAVFGSDGQLKLFNPAVAKIWGLNPKVLVTQPHVRKVVELMRPHFESDGDEDWTERADRMTAQATEADDRSGRIRRSDGRLIDWAQVALPDGASLFAYTDVTDSIKVEEALRERNEALETADRLKTEFLANVSYELRTPLNAIVGFSQMLESGYHGHLTEGQSDYIQSIVQSAEQLTTLIDDILDLASIEAGYLELDRKPHNVPEIMSSSINILRERARNQGVELNLQVAESVGVYEIDGRRLTQALFNLLSNAVKFTPPGGKVTLSARQAGEMLELSVSDTGVGIAAEDKDRVFEEFKTATSGPRAGGVGLGLSLVKRLIEMHGGEVELDSTPGEGTTVTCRLPMMPLDASNHAGGGESASVSSALLH